MQWWQVALIVIGSVIGGGCALIVGVMMYFGWRLSNRGPF